MDEGIQFSGDQHLLDMLSRRDTPQHQILRRGEAQVLVGAARGDTAALCALYKAKLEEEWLVYLGECCRFFRECRRNVSETEE